MRKLNIINCGQLDYDSTHQLQLNVLKQVQNGTLEDSLILVEHPRRYHHGTTRKR